MTLDELCEMERADVRAAIDRCTDHGELAAIFAGANEQYLGLREDVDCFSFAGTADGDWLRRAGGRMSHLTKIRRWSEWRLLALGGEVPWPPGDPRNRKIRALEANVIRLKGLLRAAGLEVSE